MKKFIIALAATGALAVSAPAVAQNYGNQNYGNQNYGGQNYGGNIQLRVDQLRTQLQAGVQSGAISRSEAMPLREQLRQLSRVERQYAINGISGRERADLQHRINSLRQGIRMASRDYDRNGRYDRDDDRYERSGDRRYDRNNDGWVDRDGDRDGRWQDDDDRYDRDDVRSNDRGLIGQVIDSVTGRDGLRVGQRVSANLGAVPYAYRDQFRDGNGAYYRTDGRQIYQVDARTHTIVRIFTMNR